MKTMTIKKGGGSKLSQGWKVLEISKATYSTYEGAKVLDMWFKDLPENLNVRVYSKVNKAGEEWAIAQVFRFANAGLKESLTSANGDMVVQFDDSADNLVGKHINVYLHPDPKNEKYNRVLRQMAPTVFENAVESFTDDDVAYWKKRAEKYYHEFIETNTSNGTSNGFVQEETLPLSVQGGPAEDAVNSPVTSDDIPF